MTFTVPLIKSKMTVILGFQEFISVVFVDYTWQRMFVESAVMPG